MLDKDKIQEIENIIGYVFKDESFLIRAFTHPSLKSKVNENYQVLEFLGDSILDFIIAERLMLVNPNWNEGTLTKVRARIVSEQPLSDAIGRLRLTEFMQLGVGESRRRVYENDSIKCDLFESIVGAIYLDGGMDDARAFVLKTLGKTIEHTAPQEDVDAKSKLNEYATKYSKTIDYVLVNQTGPVHKPTFEMEVYVDGVCMGNGKGVTKQSAQQWAAKEALHKLLG